MKGLLMRYQNFGFVRVAAAVPVVEIGEPFANIGHMAALAAKAHGEGVQMLAFPELCITGYTCGDAFSQELLIDQAYRAFLSFAGDQTWRGMLCIVGLPLRIEGGLYNAAAFVANGKVLGIVPKGHIPNYKEFYERRWFGQARDLNADSMMISSPGSEPYAVPVGTNIIIDAPNIPGLKVAADVCEDIWMPNSLGERHALHGATVLVNISASNDTVGKAAYRRLLVNSRSGRCVAAQVYVSCGPWESSAETVFAGDAMISVNGTVVAESKRFSFDSQLIVADVDVAAFERERSQTGTFGDAAAQERSVYVTVPCYIGLGRMLGTLRAPVEPFPFVPSDPTTRDARCEEVFDIQVTGLIRRLLHVFRGKKPQITIGVSGGLDSTLALLVLVKAYRQMGWDLSGIIAVTMPGPGTTPRTLKNALKLCKRFGVTLKRIPITKAVERHLRAIEHEPCWECLTCENAQARERTKILMDMGFMINTSDMSEAVLGWCTYGGDQDGMYGVNIGVAKTLVRHIVDWEAKRQPTQVRKLLVDILETPISPELTKAMQQTESKIGPYALHDFFIWHALRHGAWPEKIRFLAEHAFAGAYDKATIKKWLVVFYERLFAAQFKRDASPNGPKVGSVCVSPRSDLRLPSDMTGRLWIDAARSL